MAEFNVIYYKHHFASMKADEKVMTKPRFNCHTVFSKLSNQYIAGENRLDIPIQKLNARLQRLTSMDWTSITTFNLK